MTEVDRDHKDVSTTVDDKNVFGYLVIGGCFVLAVLFGAAASVFGNKYNPFGRQQ